MDWLRYSPFKLVPYSTLFYIKLLNFYIVSKIQETNATSIIKKAPSLGEAISKAMRLSRRVLFVVLGVIVWIFLAWRIVPYLTESLQAGHPIMENLSLTLIAIAMILIPVNYGIEAAKWHYLVFKKSNSNYWLAYKSVLSGMALGILTPSRVGEPFTRALMVPNGSYINSAAAALICSLSQLAATLLFGIIGALTLTNLFNTSATGIPGYVVGGAILFVIAALLLLLSPTMLKWISNHHFTKKVLQSLSGIDSFSLRQIATVQALSIARYCVFLLQYCCILYAFGCSLSPLHIVSAVACIFLVGSAIPAPTIVDAGIKISLAILFLGSTLDNEKVAAAASTTIWVMNIAIPALVGTIFAMTNTFDTEKQQKKQG